MQFAFTALLPASGYAMVDWLLTTNQLVLVAPLGTIYGGLPAAFSADGRQLAYVDFGGNFTDFRVINVDGSNPRDITPLGEQGNAFGFDWSPVQNVLVFPVQAFSVSGNEQLVLAPPVDNGRAQAVQLTHPPDVPGVVISDVFPAFSPNGAQVAYARWIDRTPSGGGFTTELHRINVNGTNDSVITVLPGEVVIGISWKPDGSSLVFDRGVTGSNGLWILDSSELHQLQNPPAWAPAWDAPSGLLRNALKWGPQLIAKAGFCHSTASVHLHSSPQSPRSEGPSASGKLSRLIRGRFKHRVSHPWPVEPANLDICKSAHFIRAQVALR